MFAARLNQAARAAVLLAAAATLFFIGEAAMSIEKPQYTVVYKSGDVEFRQYEPYLVAETVVENSAAYNDAGNEGFRRLFRYITGNNKSQSKIAMTAPVAQSKAGEKIAMTAPVARDVTSEGWRVAFMLPAKYSFDTAPVPTDPRVNVSAVPGRLMAVLRYSGRWTDRNFQRKRSALLKSLESAQVETVGNVQSAFYNAPFTLPFLRRNEVMIEVDALPASADPAAVAELTANGT